MFGWIPTVWARGKKSDKTEHRQVRRILTYPNKKGQRYSFFIGVDYTLALSFVCDSKYLTVLLQGWRLKWRSIIFQCCTGEAAIPALRVAGWTLRPPLRCTREVQIPRKNITQENKPQRDPKITSFSSISRKFMKFNCLPPQNINPHHGISLDLIRALSRA